MPTTPTELRRLLVRLSNNAESDLAALWANLDESTVSEGLFDVVPALVDSYGDAAADVTAEWYDEYRSDLNVSGRFLADVRVLDLGAYALAGWGAKLAERNFDTALPLVSGGVVKRVMNASRETIMSNVDADPRARGWQRQTSPGSCAFCQMLAGRGDVYTALTADFASHDNCKCVCAPAFNGLPAPVRAFTPSARTTNDADRERAKDWMAENL
ncbi:VG15 protein [Rhodococcus sp. Leaf233]|uniref:VG15 protein n=1 Tax=Rhodococcus sp. Leaf233 TaxID=1736302 RepID=UPI0012E3720C